MEGREVRNKNTIDRELRRTWRELMGGKIKETSRRRKRRFWKFIKI